MRPEDVADLFSGEERHRLAGLLRAAMRAEMSVWAYAVHTGKAADLRLTRLYRLVTDMALAREVLAAGGPRRVEPPAVDCGSALTARATSC